MSNLFKIDYYGSKRNIKIVLLPGALLSTQSFEELIDHLKPRYYVLAVELFQDQYIQNWPEEPSIEWLAKKVFSALNLKEDEKVVLCGHSFGGMMAQYLASFYPDSVESIILIDSAYTTHLDTSNFATRIPYKLLGILPKLLIVKLTTTFYGAHNKQTRRRLSKELSRTKKDHIRKALYAPFNFDGLAYLKRIKAPTLLLPGELNLLTHRQNKRMNGIVLKSQIHFIPKASHLANWENPAFTHRKIDEFLGDQRQVSGANTERKVG